MPEEAVSRKEPETQILEETLTTIPPKRNRSTAIETDLEDPRLIPSPPERVKKPIDQRKVRSLVQFTILTPIRKKNVEHYREGKNIEEKAHI